MKHTTNELKTIVQGSGKTNYMTNNAIQNGYSLAQAWLEFVSYKKVSTPNKFNLAKFKQLVKDTYLYFQQLNTMNTIDIYSNDFLSIRVCYNY